MRNRVCNNLCLVVFSMGALTTMASAQGDPNLPWDPAEHFVPYWESVELEARLDNPARRPEADPNTQRRLNIQGTVEMVDYDDLVGISRRERAVVAVDQDGIEIYRTNDGLMSRSYESTENIKRWAGLGQRLDEFQVSMSVPMDPNEGYPSSLSRLEWSIDALVAGAFAVVEVPFEPNESWIELVPGLEILVEEASVEEGKYAYKIQAIYDRALISFGSVGHWHFWSDEVPAATMLIETDMLNAGGQSVHDLGSSGGFSTSTSSHTSDDGLTTATTTGNGSCSTCGDVTTIRYTFALDPYEQEARFVLENVPVPSF